MKNGQYSSYYTLITVATALKKVVHVENNATTAKVVRASGGIGLRATRTIETRRMGIGTPMDLDGGRCDDRWMGECPGSEHGADGFSSGDDGKGMTEEGLDGKRVGRHWSPEARHWVSRCLVKNAEERATYPELLVSALDLMIVQR